MPIWKIGPEKQAEWCRKMGKLYGGKKRSLKDKECIACKKIFRPRSLLTKFCSYKCAVNNRPKKGIIKKCVICNKEFYSMQCFIKKSKYCSNNCRNIGTRKGMYKTCKCCNKTYLVRLSQIKWRGSSYCSRICMKKYRRENYLRNKNMKNKPREQLKKQLWTLFSRYIRQRDNGICISCGKIDNWKNTDAGHYIPKTAGLSIYFDERNVNCQCTSCNRFKHGNLSAYAIALRKKYGETILEELEEIRKNKIIISEEEYEKLIIKYRLKLKENGFK